MMNAASPAIPGSKPYWLALALVALAPLLVLAPALTGGFLIWDDNVNLLSNPALWRNDGALRWMFTDFESVQRYKPLNWLLWRLLGESFGLNPVAFHACNVVLHAINSVLLFQVITRFLAGRPSLRAAPAWVICFGATCGTLTWALHPLRAEPVAWISGAGYPLATAFALLAVLAFQQHLQNRRPAWQGLAAGCFILSLLSYPAAAALPALLLVMLWLDDRPNAWNDLAWFKRTLRRLLPFALPAVLLLGLTLHTRLNVSGETWHEPASLEQAELHMRVMQAVAVWTWYLEKSLLPLHLSPVYVEFRAFPPWCFRALASVVILALVSLLAWRKRHGLPEAGALWLAFLALAVPTLGVTDIPFSPSDRYTYVPGLALALLTAFALSHLTGRTSPIRRGVTMAVSAGLLAILLTATGRQLNIWRSPISFFHHAQASIAPHPTASDLHWRLGLHYLMMDNPTAARAEFESTLRLNPQHPDAARYLRVLQRRATPADDRSPTS